MQEQEQNLEELVQAVCWKLYLEPPSRQLEEKWQKFEKSSNYRERVVKICKSLAEIWQRVYAYRLGIHKNTPKEVQEIEFLLSSLLGWLSQKTQLVNDDNLKWQNITNRELKDSVRSAIRKALSSPSPELPLIQIPTSQPSAPIAELNENQSLRPPEDQSSTNKQTTSPDVAQWKYLPVPQDEPDPHTEYDVKSRETPEKMKIIGARVRGKMHKHQGTNCDDWFEFTTSGEWTIIAVSDGAGSSKFSRIGAKASCEAAIKYLANELKSHKIKDRNTTEDLSAELRRDQKSWAFVGQDIEFVQNRLHEAMKVAYNAIVAEAKKRQDSWKHVELLGQEKIYIKDLREINIKDLSATLLLAAHTTIKVGETKYSLVLTCQVGDGMLAAISQEGRLMLLGQPDSGEFAGQTEFVTSKNKIEKDNLLRKTFVFPGHLKVLMVMTDGVADNYFPNDPGILELYGDLVLNQVINISKPSDIEISEHLRSTKLVTIDGVKDCQAHFQDLVERILADNSIEQKKINIISVAKYADRLGKSVAEVVNNPALLASGIMEEGMCNKCKDMPPEEKLKIWLDAYYQKGSFDDRTLVIFYKEKV